MTPRFGISTHLFHNERFDRRHVDAIAAHGFDLVEIFATRTHIDYRDASRVRELAGWLAGAGLQAGSMHAPIFDAFRDGAWGRPYSNASPNAVARQAAVDETRAAIDAARELGCHTLVLHVGIPRGAPSTGPDNDGASARRSLETIHDAAHDAGLALALELIPNDLSTPASLVAWLDTDGDPLASGVCLDVGHAHLMGGAPEAIEALSGHVITTHLHDNRGRDDDHLVPFAGTIDWTLLMTTLWKIGYGGPLVFEVADHGDAAGVLARTAGARRRLQAILDDLSSWDFADEADDHTL